MQVGGLVFVFGFTAVSIAVSLFLFAVVFVVLPLAVPQAAKLNKLIDTAIANSK